MVAVEDGILDYDYDSDRKQMQWWWAQPVHMQPLLPTAAVAEPAVIDHTNDKYLKTTMTLEIYHTKKIPIEDYVAGRAWTIDGVENVMVTALSVG